MPLFKVKWQHETWHTTYVEADTELEAKEKIFRAEYRASNDSIIGTEIQEYMEAEQADNV